MKIVFLIISLVVVLVTLENLIVSRFYAKSHRLLPLVLGLLALYHFYLIVELLTGQTETFYILKQLLLINILDVILYYILDFVEVRLPMWANGLVLVLLVLMDILVFAQIDRPGIYHPHVVAFVVVSVVGIIIFVSLKAPKSNLISMQMRRNRKIMLVALLVPAIALILDILKIIDEEILLPLAIDVACIILDYLFWTDRLREVDSVLKEEHFQTLNMPAFLFDSDLFFLDASKKARELFEEQIAEIERTPQEYELQKQLVEMQNSDGILYRTINGRFYRCQLQEAQYKGKKKGYILTFTDITEQKNETDMAKEVARQKSDFLANMSHDLRSPLHAIIGSSEIVLSRDEMSSRARTMVNNIHEAGNNLLDIVNSILEFSKLESGNITLHPQKYNFKTLVEEQARVGFINLRDKDVVFSIEVVDPFPEYMMGDEIRIRQIVQNLISNAVKFTDSGYIKCRFNVSIEDEKQIKIKYSVEDTGDGMTPEQVTDVFADYVTYAQEHKKEGTGLGLSIVRKLCEMMGGNAWAESDGETGTTVYAEFIQELVSEDVSRMVSEGIALVEPIYIRNEKSADTSTLWRNDVIPNYVFPDAHILIADDMAVNCEILKELASPWQVKIDIAKNGLEAVNLVKEKEYDLIFLDQMMPVMSGTEAADMMNEENIKTPKILLTANITEAMRESSKAHGFSAFMHKPIDIAQLRTNLENYLPDSLRMPYSVEKDLKQINLAHDEKYIRALSTYISEMETLYKLIPDYKDHDSAMFRNKVHGIKGVSRQIGKKQIALMAEIMEMAAITDNQDFINNYFPIFYGELEYTIDAGKLELERLRQNRAEQNGENGTKLVKEPNKVSREDITILLTKLKEALESYEMTMIDNILEEISLVSLPENVLETFNQVKDLYEDMEYEEALETLQKIEIG